MVKVELKHNPFLLETYIAFNGYAPRVNSQVEKYMNLDLKSWVQKVPDIFYNEMNGYDFDLFFSGTKDDFSALSKAFAAANVTAQEVRLIQQNVLRDAEEKSKDINSLIKWLQMNPNHMFSYENFWANNAELFEGDFVYILLGYEPSYNYQFPLNIETVENVHTLDEVALDNTPILFFITEKKWESFCTDLQYFLKRADVKQQQLFFMIDPKMNTGKITRVIVDLGVERPTVVEKYDADEVMDYFRNYPLTEYVQKAVQCLKGELEEVAEKVAKANKRCKISNAQLNTQIEILQNEIDALKKADEYFLQCSEYRVPVDFVEKSTLLEEKIMKWRNRKTKVIGEQEAQAAAEEYEKILEKAVNEFIEAIMTVFHAAGEYIWSQFLDNYTKPGIDLDFKPKDICLDECSLVSLPDLKEELLALKEVTYVEVKSDLLGIFRKSTDSKIDLTPMTICYYEQWRVKAAQIIMPIANNYSDFCAKALEQYYKSLAKAFHEHLTDLFAARIEQKEKLLSRLSEQNKI